MKHWLILLAAFPLLASAAAERIVSLGGDVTEVVYALDAQRQLVAKDSTSTWPAAAQSLPDVGYIRQLNAEGILSLRPTLVLASAQAQPSLVLKKVEENKVKVINVPGGYDLPAIEAKIGVIADALGKQSEGNALRQKIHQQIAQIPSQPVNKRVLFILSHGGMNTMVAGETNRGGWRNQGGRAAKCHAELRPLSQHVAGGRYRQYAGPGGDLRRWAERHGRRSRALEAAGAGADACGTP